MKTSATLFLFPLILAACAQTPPAEIPQTPADIAWHLVRLEGQEVPAKAGVEPAYLRLTRSKAPAAATASRANIAKPASRSSLAP